MLLCFSSHPPCRPAIRREFFPMLRIAVPVVMAELGWMAMGVVDTVMVGPLGPQAISAAGVGNSMHIAFAIFGMGVLLGLDTLVSQAFGARDIRECHRLFFDGLSLAALMALPIMALLAMVWFAIPVARFSSCGRAAARVVLRHHDSEHAVPAGYATCRRYLQGMHAVTPVMFALVTANLINAGANWVLIYGHFGFPALGVAGSAWATVIARAYMLACCSSRCGGSTRNARVKPVPTDHHSLGKGGGPVASRVASRPGAAAASSCAGRARGIADTPPRLACSRWPRRCRGCSIRFRARRIRSRSTWPASRS